jgi:hypothetical protein
MINKLVDYLEKKVNELKEFAATFEEEFNLDNEELPFNQSDDDHVINLIKNKLFK